MRRALDDLDEALSAPSSARAASPGAPPSPEAGALGARSIERARSIVAEITVAERLLASGCAIEHERETPSGRRVDFRARRDGAVLDLHVKRAPLLGTRPIAGAIPRAWRALEELRRGMVVALALERNVRGSALLGALADATDFIEQASIGETCIVRGADGDPIARLRAVAPAAGSRVELVGDPAVNLDDQVRRLQATLRKAFAQFMPRSENLIVVCGVRADFEAFATALLGSHVERWDRRPRAGENVAYGRGGDGFWAGSLRSQSRIAAFWPLEPGAQPRLFIRGGLPSRGGSDRTRAASGSPALELARSIFA